MIFQPKVFSSLLVKYRLIIIPLIPLLFFVIILTALFVPSFNNQKININPTPTNKPDDFENILTPDLVKEVHEAEIEKPLDSFAGFQKQESLPDGTNLYTFSSPIPGRANIIISKGNEDVLFQRNITHPNFPVKIVNFTNVYGPIKWVFKGSNFYGPNAHTHIYPELGIAFIANTTTGDVLEQHVFLPTKVEEYVKKYGEDIPTQP